MAGISTSVGVGSGLQIDKLVSQLVQAERAGPERRLNSQEQRLSEELSALGKFKGALSKFNSSLEGIADFSKFTGKTAKVSDSDILSASASSDAVSGTYDVDIQQLARSNKLATPAGAFGASDDVVGTGELTFQFGTYDSGGDTFTLNPDRASETVTIDAESNTLEGVRDAVNEADIGVRANIVDDGSGARLTFTSEETGEANGMRINVADDDGNDTDTSGLSRLAYDPTTAGPANLVETQAAQDASAIIDGIAVTSADNSLDDVVDGLSLDLKDTGTSEVSVSENQGSARSAVEGFVEAYNSFMNTANALTKWDEEKEKGGPLIGDTSVRMAVSRVQRMLSTPVEGVDGPFQTLSGLGIATQNDGTLNVDSEQLNKALDQDMEAVGRLLSNSGKATDDLVEFEGNSSATQSGTYALEVTQEATQGSYTGNGLGGFPIDITADNDEFSLSVNDVRSNTIKLTQGTYNTAADLAAEMQSQINGDEELSDAGIETSVSVTAGELEILSGGYGSDTRVDVESVDNTTAGTLGLTVREGTAGDDVAGLIGGLQAEGYGRTLEATGGPAEGMRILVDGGGTGGRGSVTYSRGFAAQMEESVESFLGREGTVTFREDSLENRLDEVDRQREQLSERMSQIEQRYRSQFASLDASLAGMQQTSNWLQQNLGGGGGMASIAGKV
jgi:flagellar hook-associated protein 2